MLSEKAWRRREKREKRRSISRLKTKKKRQGANAAVAAKMYV